MGVGVGNCCCDGCDIIWSYTNRINRSGSWDYNFFTLSLRHDIIFGTTDNQLALMFHDSYTNGVHTYVRNSLTDTDVGITIKFADSDWYNAGWYLRDAPIQSATISSATAGTTCVYVQPNDFPLYDGDSRLEKESGTGCFSHCQIASHYYQAKVLSITDSSSAMFSWAVADMANDDVTCCELMNGTVNSTHSPYNQFKQSADGYYYNWFSTRRQSIFSVRGLATYNLPISGLTDMHVTDTAFASAFTLAGTDSACTPSPYGVPSAGWWLFNPTHSIFDTNWSGTWKNASSELHVNFDYLTLGQECGDYLFGPIADPEVDWCDCSSASLTVTQT